MVADLARKQKLRGARENRGNRNIRNQLTAQPDTAGLQIGLAESGWDQTAAAESSRALDHRIEYCH